MSDCIGCDMHKKYSVFVAVGAGGQVRPAVRIEHQRREELRSYLGSLEPGTPIAVETTGNWYWMIEEMEQAGHVPLLAHAGKAKLMMGQVNKTDKLDARGLGLLLYNGTLPTVWIPPGELRDQRELVRHRLSLVAIGTGIKNRLHATLAKYGLRVEGVSDLFGVRGRVLLRAVFGKLPPQTRQAAEAELGLLEQVQARVLEAEKRMRQMLPETPEVALLQTLPGVGLILGMVLALEIGSVERFMDGPHLASYAGLVPRVHASGGRSYLGPTRRDVNRYLKWAFVEAANVIARNREAWSQRHAVQLYQRLASGKGHGKAVVAVARHLAEAAWAMLRKGEPYREPQRPAVSSTPR